MIVLLERLVKFGLPLIGLLCMIYIMFNCFDQNYELLFTLPLLYIILSFFLMRRFSLKSSVFFIVINLIIFFRYVIQPYLIVSQAYYKGRSPIVPQESSFIIAHLLMLAELLLVSIVMLHLESKFQQKKLTISTQFSYGKDKNWIYYLFILFTVVYAVFDQSWIGIIHFVTPIIDLSDEKTFSIYVPYLILIAKQVLIVILIYKLGRKSASSPGRDIFLIIVALVLAFLNISIFLGTNRSDILITAIATLLLLKRIFRKKISTSFVLVALVAVFGIVNVVTEARGMKKLNDSEQNYAELLNAYLGGVYNVAIATETVDYYPDAGKPKVFLYDIFRPMIGVNFFLKGDDVVWSNTYFNRRLLNEDRRSQILPMIGQGYIFFGILAPLLSVVFVVFAYYLMNYVYSTRDPLIFYFLLLSVIRLGFFMGQNTMNQINDLSYNLVLFLFLFFFNRKLQLK